ncbi:MFS transporter [Paractinoplanes atraurantiacus]|uniref:Transmembrane secretion effector n=1 Tax=Paractinoplanes atraurantiacus TaxID=1036182 RepID=A0A285KN85_9ACTN|nr:MFS transporter [Actinoplanes atraurantiacus]SNY74070.1 Transmembrane secretion effector [Actinoplanes atraurantiacus]
MTSSALAVPAFRRLWIAGLVSDAGDWLMFIALPLVVLQLTGSALGTSFAFLLELAPPVLIAPLAGRVADRLPRRLVMVVAMLAQACSLLPLLAVHDRSDLPILYGVIVAHASFAAFFEPAKNAMLPALVGPGRAVSANALVGLNNDLGRLAGGPLGGVLLAVAGLSGVVLVDIATYLVAASLVATLPRERARPAVRPAGRPKSGPAVRAPIVVAFVAAVAQGLFLLLFVFFVTDILGGAAADVGVLRGVQAVGAIAAGVVLGMLGARLDIVRLTIAGSIVFTVLTALTWNLSFLTHAMPVYVVLFAIIGAPGVLLGAGLTSLLQQASDDSRRGSAFAAFGLAQAIGQALGLLAGGLLQSVSGTLPLLEAQAGTYAVAAMLALILLRTTGRRQNASRSASPVSATSRSSSTGGIA